MESWFEKSLTPVTPREIAKSVNKIVGLMLQWGTDRISYETLAYFSINRYEVDKDIRVAINSSDAALNDISPDWRRELAALHFGVPLEHAAQILMTDPIERSFLSGQNTLLDELKDVTGFGDVFEAVTAALPVRQGQIKPTLQTIANAVRFIPEVAISQSDIWEQTVWKNLLKAFNDIDVFDVFPSMAAQVNALLDKSNSADINDIVSTVERLVDQLLSAETISISQITEIATIGTKAIDVAKSFDMRLPVFDLKGTAAQYLSRLHAMRGSEAAQRRTRNQSTHSEIVTDLVARVTDAQRASTVTDLLSLLTSTDATLMIKSVLEGADAVITEAEGAIRSTAGDSVITRSALRTLLASDRLREEGRAALERLANDGTIVGRLPQLATQNDQAPLAIAIAALTWKGISVASPIGSDWSSLFNGFPNIASYINSTLETLCRSDESALDKFVLVYDSSYKSWSLISGLLHDRVERRSLGSIFPETVLKNLHSYTKMMDWRDRDRFTGLLASGYDNFSGAVERVDWSSNIYDVTVALKRSGAKSFERFHDQVIKRINDTSTDEWISAIKNGNEPFRIATQVVNETDVNFGLSSSLFSAMIEISSGDKSISNKALERLLTLTQILARGARKRFYATLSSELPGKRPADIYQFLKVGGDKFISDSKLLANANYAINNIVIPTMTLKAGRVWLSERSTMIERQIKRADLHTTEELSTRLDALQRSRDQEKKDWATTARNEWLSSD